MSSFLRHFHACNAYNPARFRPLTIGGKPLGFVPGTIADLLHGQEGMTVLPDAIALHGNTPQERTKILDTAVAHLLKTYPLSRKLRGEIYPVKEKFEDEPLALLDRAAVPWFGIRAWGVHVNGYVKKADGLYLWVAERSHDRIVAPGQYDHIIAGGQPHGLSLAENLRKEAAEEAGMDAALANQSKPIGTMSYKYEQKDGLRNDTLYIYDLEVPDTFKPRNTDGEVAAFHLMPAAVVAELIRTQDKFKFNVNMVITDFLIRHGVIAPPELTDLKPYLAA